MTAEVIKTYVYFDTETTGLPYIEHNKTRIVELCCTAVQAEYINAGVIPRILPKINLCFNPRKMIQPGATEASGLTNEILANQPEFSFSTAEMLYNFLNVQAKPVCFVAHNGNRFDFPILRAELQRVGTELPDDVLCADSLIAFRQLYNEDVEKKQTKAENLVIDIPDEFDDDCAQFFSILENLKNSTHESVPTKPIQKPLTIEEIKRQNETTPKKQTIKRLQNSHTSAFAKRINFGKLISFKLSNLYTLLTRKNPTDAHKAEYDVIMLIECTAKLGQRFTNWANLNAVLFCDIPVMRPGKYIGT